MENNALFYIFSTAMKRKAEPEQAGGDGEAVGVSEAQEVQPSIHELEAKVKPLPN